MPSAEFAGAEEHLPMGSSAITVAGLTSERQNRETARSGLLRRCTGVPAEPVHDTTGTESRGDPGGQ